MKSSTLEFLLGLLSHGFCLCVLRALWAPHFPDETPEMRAHNHILKLFNHSPSPHVCLDTESPPGPIWKWTCVDLQGGYHLLDFLFHDALTPFGQ